MIITYAVDAKGNRKEVLGTKDSRRKHRELFRDVKLGLAKLPPGAQRLEVWELQQATSGIDLEAQKRRLAESDDKKLPAEAPKPDQE